MTLSLNTPLWVGDTYGPVAASTVTYPLPSSAVNFGDGVFVEEATTNLIANPSFEVDTASWGTGANATLTRVATTAFQGSACAKQAINGAGNAYSTISFATTNGQTYTVSMWIKAAVGSTTGSMYVGSAVGVPWAGATVSIAPVANVWTRYTVTGVATSATGVITIDGTGTGTAFYIDAVQAENKAYATSFCDGSLGAGYAWTGTANASTSTRAGGSLRYTLTNAPSSAITVCGWARAGYTTALAARFPMFFDLNTGTGTNAFRVFVNAATGQLQVQKVAASVAVVATSSVVLAPSDRVFWAMRFDSSNLTISVSKNGSSVVENSTSTSTVPVGATSLYIGNDYASSVDTPANGSLEQVLVYNRALSTSEIIALANATAETTYDSDAGIVFAAQCGSVRGTTQAMSPAGTNFTRWTRKGNGLITPYTGSPGFTTTLPVYKVTVPAGWGIGAGAVLAQTAEGASQLTVRRVMPASGGLYDELLVA